ncbi:histidine kinase, partial [Streptomyces sp. B1866]|nr:histidine kinase [Streptomyces sp. B1866]
GGPRRRHARPRPPRPSWARSEGSDDSAARDAPSGPDRRAPARHAGAQLPRRMRQASLAPQLKQDPVPEAEADRPSADPDPEREAEQARATMSSLQRGWQRARERAATGAGGSAGTAPGTTHEGESR